MTRFKKLLPTAIAAVLVLSGCEIFDAFEVAVSGPHCGKFGVPVELENNGLDILDWDRIDGSIKVLQPYKHTHGPDILFGLGYLHARKSATLSSDPAHSQRAVRFLTWAALCGHGPAASYLGGFYRAGVLGLEKDPELGACLEGVYNSALYERALIPGRVWGCGVRMKDFPE
jgi:hypothetical protein